MAKKKEKLREKSHCLADVDSRRVVCFFFAQFSLGRLWKEKFSSLSHSHIKAAVFFFYAAILDFIFPAMRRLRLPSSYVLRSLMLFAITFFSCFRNESNKREKCNSAVGAELYRLRRRSNIFAGSESFGLSCPIQHRNLIKNLTQSLEPHLWVIESLSRVNFNTFFNHQIQSATCQMFLVLLIVSVVVKKLKLSKKFKDLCCREFIRFPVYHFICSWFSMSSHLPTPLSLVSSQLNLATTSQGEKMEMWKILFSFCHSKQTKPSLKDFLFVVVFLQKSIIVNCSARPTHLSSPVNSRQ